jgi:hypothetical protein
MKRLVFLTGLCMTAALLKAQDEPAPAPAPADIPAATPTAPAAGGGRGGGPVNEPRPYDRVITKEAKTSEGIFKVHKIKERGADTYYYEIPASELGKDFLFVGQIAQNTIGAGYGGQGVNEFVGLGRHESRVLREITTISSLTPATAPRLCRRPIIPPSSCRFDRAFGPERGW